MFDEETNDPQTKGGFAWAQESTRSKKPLRCFSSGRWGGPATTTLYGRESVEIKTSGGAI
jgi:hypothetical protein